MYGFCHLNPMSDDLCYGCSADDYEFDGDEDDQENLETVDEYERD